MARLSKSDRDLVTSFTIYLNGEKLGGVHALSITADMRADLTTRVNLTLGIERDSFKLVHKDGLRLFYFDAFGLKKHRGELDLSDRRHVEYTTRADHTHNDIIIMNGKKLNGCQNFKYSLSAKTNLGTVELELYIKKNGLEIKRRRRGRKDVYLEI